MLLKRTFMHQPKKERAVVADAQSNIQPCGKGRRDAHLFDAPT